MVSLFETFLSFWFLLLYFIKMYLIGVYIIIKELAEGNYNPSEEELPESKGVVGMVTGGTEGIGLEVVRLLASRSVTVFIASLNKTKGEQVVQEIKFDHPSAEVYYLSLDLRSLKSVKECVKTFYSYNKPLHILINNAGVMVTPHFITEDGFEQQFQVNFLSHYYLTTLLLDKLVSSGSHGQVSRIVNITSAVHLIAGDNMNKLLSKSSGLFQYSPHFSYSASKLAIILATYSLARELKGNNSAVTVNCLHPGVVNTGLYRNLHWSIKWVMVFIAEKFFKTPQQAGRSVAFVAMTPQLECVSGCYYDNCKSVKSSHLSYNQSLQEELISRIRNDLLVSDGIS